MSNCKKLSFSVAKRRETDSDAVIEYKNAKTSNVTETRPNKSLSIVNASKSAAPQPLTTTTTTRKRAGNTTREDKKRSKTKQDKVPATNNRSIKEFLRPTHSNHGEPSPASAPTTTVDASSPKSVEEPVYFKIRDPRPFCEIWEPIVTELLDYPSYDGRMSPGLHEPASLRKCPVPYRIEDYYGDEVTMALLQALEADDPSENYSRPVRNRMTAKESAEYIARIAEELLS